MTLEAKKANFKKTWTVFIPTVILCWIICWFTNGKYALTDVTLLTCGLANGLTCFITPIICGLIAYPLTKSGMKKAIAKKMANPDEKSEPAPETGDLDSQIMFFHWIPKNWFCYLFVFSLIAGIFFGYGLPTLIGSFATFIVKAGVGSRLFIALIGGVQIGWAAQFSAYLSNIYFVKLLEKKLVPKA